ncbi:MAG TPA: class I SAM-dependent methyltransferase [Gaiellaceae bacterium]|nr:class I SAM-dependent methyltransferase [Gaiellaceae bacterium]
MGLGDHLAPFVTDALGAPFERKPFAIEHRRRLLEPAEGRVLEIGAGTGFNLPYYPEAVSSITLTDALDGMLRRARRRAATVGRQVEAVRAPAEALPFDDGTFDTVVGSLVLCSVSSQQRALAEVRRVLRPGGRYLFLEHVRADDPDLARRQDRWSGVWKTVCFGCHPNRRTLEQIEAVLAVEEVERGVAPGGMPKLVRPFVLGRAVAR